MCDNVRDAYPEKYRGLIDDETWAFIEETNSWYPPDAVDYSIEKQRAIYDKMCSAFFAGYPDGVVIQDSVVPEAAYPVPIRHYHKSGTTPAAEVVYYHGGGFVVGGLESHDDVCAEICGLTGFNVTSVDYRLAPEHTFPSDFDDALAGFQTVAVNTRLPVIVVGDSAGGNLAAAVSHATRGGAKVPAGQVLIYPGLGSDLTRGSFVDHADAPMLTTKDTTFYKTIRTGGDEERLCHKHCTPLNDSDFSALPSTVVISAQCDPLSDNGRDYCDKILKAGGRAVWFNEEGLVHGYLRGRHRVKRAGESFARIVKAIEVLGQARWPY